MKISAPGADIILFWKYICTKCIYEQVICSLQAEKGGKIMERGIKPILAVLVSVFLIVSLTSCGGGGGGGTTTGGGTTPTLSGTVATGRPLASVAVYLKDSKGNTRSTITDANGKFSFDTTDLTPPFYLRTGVWSFFLHRPKIWDC